MAIAASPFPAVISPVLSAFWQWLHRPAANDMPSASEEGPTSGGQRPPPAPVPVGSRAQPAPVPRRWGGPVRPGSPRTRQPLRVVRVFDGSAARGAGRMVISGRMADVCAELDRLAALESARG